MDRLKHITKLGLVTILIGLIIAGAFALGYRAGNQAEERMATIESDDVSLSEAPDPIATTTPLLSPPAETKEPVNTATAIPVPSTPDDTLTKVPTAEANLKDDPTIEPTVMLSDDETLQVLYEVWNLVEAEFYGDLPSPEERAYGAIRGMLETLDDDYTSFIEPSIAEITRSDASGTFEGIGALVRMNDDDILEIVRPFEGQPADQSGLLPGDLVLAVDEQSIIGYGIYEAITLIRGPEGTAVILTVQRGVDTDPFDVTIVRARIDIPIVESELLKENVGYVALFDFSAQATTRLEAVIEELLDQGAESLILDLRGNPGGFLDQAVRVSDLFLDQGVVLIERSSDGHEREFTSTDRGIAQDIPLVVLVNGGSASASEIVAGAIQDRGRALLIGEITFGKGSVQLPHTLSDGSELRVTIARWFTPNDRAIHGDGLIPDIEIPLTPEDAQADRDPQLDRAIEYLETGQ